MTGDDQSGVPPPDWFRGLAERHHLREVALDAGTASAAAALPLIHRDPFDRGTAPVRPGPGGLHGPYLPRRVHMKASHLRLADAHLEAQEPRGVVAQDVGLLLG